ncbi:Hypothetical protein A7982_06665 [Minicystis rosea]|nr:Hypothetical protein A7982_06665 [Minicystis rosea]
MPSRRARAVRSASPSGGSLLVTAAAFAGLMVSATDARAQSEPVHFAWVRGQGAGACRGQQQIADQVTARLGRDPFGPNAKRSIDAYVTRSEKGWRAEIYVRSGDGSLGGARELTSEAQDCASIEAASVLAIALAIDPDAGTRPPPPAPPPSHAPPAASAAPLPPQAAPAPPPPSLAVREPPAGLGAIGAALRAGAGVGLLPKAAPALALTAHVGVSRIVQITGEALWMPEVRANDTRFAFGLTAFALGACVDVMRQRWADLAACGSLWGGALHAVVYTLAPTQPGQRAWAAAAASPRFRVRLAPHFHAEVGTQVLVPLIRQPFTVTGSKEPVFQQAPVTAVPFAGIGASFL